MRFSCPQQIFVLSVFSEKLRAGVARLKRHLKNCSYEIVFGDDLLCIPGGEDIEIFVKWLVEAMTIRDLILR